MVDKNTKEVVCDICGDEIKSTDYYVIAYDFLELKSFHDRCYSSIIKDMQSMFLDKPLNSIKMKIRAILALILGLFLIIYSFFEGIIFLFIGLFCFIPLLMLIYAWFKYERILR